MKKNNFLYSVFAIFAIAIGYFYIDKTNPTFFQDLMNKITNKDAGWKDEVIPQEKPILEDAPKPEVKPEVKPEEDKPSDEDLLPKEKKENYRRPHHRP